MMDENLETVNLLYSIKLDKFTRINMACFMTDEQVIVISDDR